MNPKILAGVLYGIMIGALVLMLVGVARGAHAAELVPLVIIAGGGAIGAYLIANRFKE